MYRITVFLASIILVIIGWFLSQSGFHSIQEIRQIERLSKTTISSSLDGEVKIQAQTRKYNKLLKSEHFNQPSIYFHYRYEVEKQDSDGNDYWSTEYENYDSVNFELIDNTGSVLVNLQQLTDDKLKISIPISQQVTRGDYRYTEWRIEPGDTVLVMGMMEINQNERQIGFVKNGQYLPIISKYSESHEKSEIGNVLILKISGGITLIAIAAFLFNLGIQNHRIIGFLLILSFSVVVPLIHLGVNMLYDDIVKGGDRLTRQSSKTLNAINDELGPYISSRLDWDSLNSFINDSDSLIPNELKQQIDQLQLNLAFSQDKYIQQLHKFPNNLLVWIYSIKPESISALLSGDLQQRLQQRFEDFEETRTSGALALVIISIGGLMCLVLSWLGFKLIRLKRHIENVPTSKSTGLVFGLSEVKGRVKKTSEEEPLISPLNNNKCYWYHYHVEQKKGSGKNSHWVTIEDKKEYRSFYCHDSYGEVKVFPRGAEIVSQHKSVQRSGSLRYTETVLKLNDKVYILGSAKIDREAGDRLIIRSDKEENPFLITNYSEHKIMMRKAIKGMLSLTIAFSSLIFSSLFLLGFYGSFSPSDYLLVALIAPTYMSILIIILHYNDLIFLKRRVFRNRSNIDVSMQKRYDLIPQLEKILSKYFSHEKGLLEQITKLRTNSLHQNSLSDYSKNLQQGQQILEQLFVTVEANPELKAVNINISLMNKIVDLENEIGLLREGFNDAVTYYNTRIEVFPDVILAKLFNFTPASLFNYPARKFSRISINFDD